MNKLSIITINYNNCRGLKKTIESVINQTYTDYEYIVIDGGSTDGSVEIIKQYSNKINFWVSEPDKGIYNAMNKGVLKATGEYCNFMNSGDCFFDKNVLKEIFNIHKSDFILGKHINNDNNKICGFKGQQITMLDLCTNGINHQSAFIKKSLFEDCLYDEKLKICSDWKFFIHALIFKNCSFENSDIVVTRYDNEGISSTNRELLFKEKEHILKEFMPQRIYDDYAKLTYSKSPLLNLTPYLNKTKGLHKLVYYITYFLIKVHYLFKKIKLNCL